MTEPGPSTPEFAVALPPGARMHEFVLKRVLGVGGFGIVYLACDEVLEREVAIKEYLPAAISGRSDTLHVTLRTQSDRDLFGLGLRSFVNEARLLARFDHPSLIKVYRFWECHGTAYMAMPVLRGMNLRDLRKQQAVFQEPWLRRLLDEILGALQLLHAAGVYHRDIAPDNIVIEPDGRPVLLDFGAARRVIGDKSQQLTAILKPAYAPIEQYGESTVLKQGPWTDFYALGATMHFLLLGKPPEPSTVRVMRAEGGVLFERGVAGVSRDMLQVIAWMLAPRPEDRPPSVQALREVLDGTAPCPLAARLLSADDEDVTVVVPRDGVAASGFAQTVRAPRPGEVAPPGGALPSVGSAAAQEAGASLAAPAAAAASPVCEAPALPTSGAAELYKAGRRPWVLGGLLAAAAVALGAVLAWPGSRAPAELAGPAAASTVRPNGLPAPEPSQPFAVPSSAAPAVPVAEPAGRSPSLPAASPVAERPPGRIGSPGTPATISVPPAKPVGLPTPAAAGPTHDARPAAVPPTEPPAARHDALSTPATSGPPAAAPKPALSGLQSTATAPVAQEEGPAARCAGKAWPLNLACMEDLCWRGKYRAHADCLAWRQQSRPKVEP